MKGILLTLYLCSLLSSNSFSQKATATFLRGSWNIITNNNKYPSTVWDFSDSNHVSIIDESREFGSPTNFIYTIDTTSTLSLFHAIGKKDKATWEFYWLVKILNQDSIQVQGNNITYYVNSPKKPVKIPIQWDDNTNTSYTSTLTRIK